MRPRRLPSRCVRRRRATTPGPGGEPVQPVDERPEQGYGVDGNDDGIVSVYDPADAHTYVDVYKKLDTAFDALLVVPTVTAAAPAPGLGRADGSGCVELL